MINQLIDLAKNIVSRTSEANQNLLLNRLNTNLTALAEHRPSLLGLLVQEITLEQAKNLVIVDEGEGIGLTLYERRQGQWVMLTNQQASLARSMDIVKNDTYQFVYFLGVGYGCEVLAWFDHTLRVPPRNYVPHFIAPLYVFETVAVYWLLFLMLHDGIRLITDKRASLYIGNSAFEQYTHHAMDGSVNEHTACLNYSFAVNRQYLDSELKRIINELSHKQSSIMSDSFEQMQVYYDKQHTHRVAQKVANRQFSQLKVLGLASRHTSFLQYCTRDLLDGFAKLGCQTVTLIESADHVNLTPYSVMQTLFKELPDIIIALDALRDSLIPEHIPYVCWIQDDLIRLVNPQNAALTPYDFIYVLGSGWQEMYRQRPYYLGHPVDVLPLGFSEGAYYPINNVIKDIDVLYVSHLIDPEMTLQPYREGRVPSKRTFRELKWLQSCNDLDRLDECMRLMTSSIDQLSMDELLPLFDSVAARKTWLDTLLSESLSEDLWLVFAELDGDRARIGNDILSQLKLRPMQQLAKAGIAFSVYGNNWNYFTELAPHASGTAGNGDALNQLHNRSKICINNSAQISFHMRALEIMASGAFMLSRRIPKQHDIMPLVDLFDEGAEIALFDETNLVEKVRYYLAQDDQREVMAKSALVKLKQHHTYNHRAEQILHDVMQRFI